MKLNKNDIIFDTIKITLLIILIIITLFPFINILAVSLNDPMDTMTGGVSLWPRVFTMVNYNDIFKVLSVSDGKRTRYIEKSLMS